MEQLNNDDFIFMNNTSIVHEISNLKSDVDKLRPIDKTQENRIMQKFRLDWNYNSNAIEGNSLDYGETAAFLMHGITAKGKPLKDYLDIKGHNEVIDYLLYIIKNKEELSERDIRSMHQMLLVEPYQSLAQNTEGQTIQKTIRIGEYKRMANHVRTITGEIHYYASPEETPILMRDLIDWYRASIAENRLHPVIIAAIFHHRFTSIHPFDDGNGRMSRLLMNLILMQYEYPPVIIKQTDKNDYYLALSQADTGNIQPFVDFIGSNLIYSLSLYIRGAKGEPIEEQSDLRKKLTLFKKEIQARRDKVELKKSPEVLEDTLENSFTPFFNDLSIVLSDFKDLFFDYKEEYVLYNTNQGGYWLYTDTNIIQKVHDIIKGGNPNSVEVFSYRFSNFKLAEDSFSIELKIALMISEIDYTILYSFSEPEELSRISFTGYHQWPTNSIVKKYYHQQILSDELGKLTNLLGESFYDFIKSIFDKSIKIEPQLNSAEIGAIWNSMSEDFDKIDSTKFQLFLNNLIIDVSNDNEFVYLKIDNGTFNRLSIEDRIEIESSLFNALQANSKSLKKVFVRITVY